MTQDKTPTKAIEALESLMDMAHSGKIHPQTEINRLGTIVRRSFIEAQPEAVGEPHTWQYRIRVRDEMGCRGWSEWRDGRAPQANPDCECEERPLYLRPSPPQVHQKPTAYTTLDQIDRLARGEDARVYPQGHLQHEQVALYTSSPQAVTVPAVTVENLARFPCDQWEDVDRCEGYSWPEHENDDGYRGGGGYVKLQPPDVLARLRENAERILRFVSRSALPPAPKQELSSSQARQAADAAAETHPQDAVTLSELIDVLHCCDTEAQAIVNRIAQPMGLPPHCPDGVQVLDDAETIIRAAFRFALANRAAPQQGGE